jgi:hypothetical protein
MHMHRNLGQTVGSCKGIGRHIYVAGLLMEFQLETVLVGALSVPNMR